MHSIQADQIHLTLEILNLIAELDEFKGRWAATQALTPDRLAALRQVATIESVGSSTSRFIHFRTAMGDYRGR